MEREIVRKLKVSELNRILPMVRETIVLERKINQLECKREVDEEFLEEVQKSIINIELILNTSQEVCAVTDKNKMIFQNLLCNQQKKAEDIAKRIDLINIEINEISDYWKMGIDLFKAILSIIVTAHGFVNKDEIQEEYLEEYIYLLSLDDEFHKRFIRGNLFKGKEALDEFYRIISNRTNGMKILNAIDEEKLDTTTFFKLFR